MRHLFYLIVVLYICTSCFHDLCKALEETKPGSRGKNKTRTSQKKFKVAKQQKLKQETETASFNELLKQKLFQHSLSESPEQLISQRQELQLQLQLTTPTTTLRRRHKKKKQNQKLLKHAQTDTHQQQQQQQQQLHPQTDENQLQDRVQQQQDFQPKLPSTIVQKQINFPSIEEPTSAATTTTTTSTTKTDSTTLTTAATSITATTTTQPFQETPLKECNIQRGKAKYHVTVVRGECCKPRRTGRKYMEQRTGDHDNSLFYNWNKEQLNNSNNPNYDRKSVDSIFKQLLTGDPNNNNNNNNNNNDDDDDDMDLDIYFKNNNNINNYINNRPQQQSHDHPLVNPPSSSSSTPEFDTSDFETVFLLDRLSKLETQLTNTKKIFQSKMFSLEQKLTASASRISFAVDQRNEQQKQQLQGIHEAMRQQHKEQLDVQEKQQSQLIRMREEFSDANTPCNRAMKSASSGLYGLDGLDDHDNNINSNNDNNVNGNNDNNVNNDLIDFTGGNEAWRNQTLQLKRMEQTRRMDSTDYNLPLKDEPGRNENGLLNSLYASFTVLRQELTEAKKELEETEKRLQAEKQEKEDIRYELNGRIEQLWALTDELRETSEKNLQLQETVAQLTTAKEQLEKELEREKEIRDNTVGQLTGCLKQFHDVNEKYQNQSILVGIIRSRLDDCITGQLPLHCEFEDERVCGFEQDSYSDHLDWIRTNGLEPSNSSKTKPPKDNTCQNARGYYMTVLVTTRMLGQVARMKTPRLFGFNEQCVEFYYWISGRYVGTLNVYTEVPDEGLLNPVWRIYGHQGDIWIKSRLNIPAQVVRSGYRMVFEGIVDRGLNGDIAIDDFKVEEGNCDAPLMKTTPNPEDGSPQIEEAEDSSGDA